MLTAKSLTKWYGDTEIFSDINLKIGNGKKVGLVGRNGCGKSTLFKILNGEEESTSGNIESQNEIFGYIPQEFNFPDELVGEYLEKSLENSWEIYKIESLAERLQFHNFDQYQKINTLSEGQKMKVKLIEELLKSPTTLFIDEPTNHLDIEGIMWLEEYIKEIPQTIIMISHDRSFLNHTVDEIWEIDKHTMYRFVGDYDNYKTEKLKLIDSWNEEYVRFLKKKAQLEKLLENVRKMKSDKRGNAVKAAKKRIEREVTSQEKELYVSKSIASVAFDTDVRSSKLMLRFNSVSKSYGTKKVFENLDFEIRGKEKVWLFGPNGAGKTTLVKMIMNQEPTTEGTIRLGENIKIGYFSQIPLQNTTNENLMQFFTRETGLYEGEAYGNLKRFLFDKDATRKRIWQLSPGERARFAFAIFASKNYDLLILDEPDNHLDIDTKEVLEKSLSEFTGTLLLVSHDRYFVESVGINKVLNLKDGKLNFL
ncbi:MAG TPA: ABC-F family ATP-binding cassette domain-containing protein [Candidatus Saccharimonadales bacterium]|nr:ABC-F family ATP-binding cassette domain-containing protein [Candidatus Saccharimonadales bacterium]